MFFSEIVVAKVDFHFMKTGEENGYYFSKTINSIPKEHKILLHCYLLSGNTFNPCIIFGSESNAIW